MKKWRKASIPATVLSLVAIALPLAATPATAQSQTFNEEIEFAAVHECTGEVVEGDTKVHMTIHTQNNPDGTMKVTIIQHTHGQQLLGAVSQDWYTFNDGENTQEEFTLLGPTGTTRSKTVFVHTTEDVAFEEEPGLDDFHRRFTVTYSPLLPPVVTGDPEGECK